MKLDSLEALLECISRFLRQNGTKDFLGLCRQEQNIVDLSKFLFTEIRLCLDARENGIHECHTAVSPDLGDIFVRLAGQARAGVLQDVLSEENRALVAETLGGVVDLAERALRKKDQALFLRNSADTDAHLSEQQKIRDLLARKDR